MGHVLNYNLFSNGEGRLENQEYERCSGGTGNKEQQPEHSVKLELER